MKKCQVCGNSFDPDTDGWNCKVAYQGKHIPTDRQGTIYILCFGKPLFVMSADRRHVSPTSHYVGWTGQRLTARVRQHGVPITSIAQYYLGTAEDEQRIKQEEKCPRCGKTLAPECLGNRSGLVKKPPQEADSSIGIDEDGFDVYPEEFWNTEAGEEMIYEQIQAERD